MTNTAESSQPARRPGSVHDRGSEADPRFSLATERTALAWIRTGFALVAGGVALSSLGLVAQLSVRLDAVAAAACLPTAAASKLGRRS